MKQTADADRVRAAIQEIFTDDDDQDGPYMIGDIVLIAEVTNADGEIQLFTLHNTDIAPWKELGFLHDRLDSINRGHFELGEIVEED